MRYKTGEYNSWDDLIRGLRAQYGKGGKSSRVKVWDETTHTWQAAPEESTSNPVQEEAKKVHSKPPPYEKVTTWRDNLMCWTTFRYTGGQLDGVTYNLTDREWMRTPELGSGVVGVDVAFLLANWLLTPVPDMVIEAEFYEVPITAGGLPE